MILFRQLSIRDKLTLALGGAAVLAFAVASAMLVLFGTLTLEGRARQIMAPYAQLISVGAGAAVDFEDPVRAEEILAALRANPQFLEVEIVLRDGRSLARYASTNATFHTHPARPDGVYLTRNRAELIQSLPEEARLHLVMSLEEFNRQTRNVLFLLAAGGLVLVVTTALGLRAVLQRTIVDPISTLAETVGQVRTLADYHNRVPDSGADEIARLGRGFNGMMVKIQERDEELRRLTLFQRTILDNVAYGIISTAPDGIVTSFNPAAERLLGYTADEVVGKLTPTDWHDPDEMAQCALELSEELCETVAPGFEVFTARSLCNLPEENEWTFVRKDGTHVPVFLSVTALRDGGGRSTGLVGLTYDLTERKLAEAEVERLKNYLENIIESMPSILVGMDRDDVVTQWNRKAEEATGIPRAEAIGRSISRLFPDFSPWINTMRGEIAQRRPTSMEKLLIEKEGERRFFDLVLYPLITNGVEGAVLSIEDVTEQARIQELMVQTEKMMSLGGLAAGMAHEINNPLGIIIQAAQNIERRVLTDLPANREAAEEIGINLDKMKAYFEKRQIPEFIGSIREASGRASRIIASILRFSRSAGTTLQPGSLADILDHALELAESDYDLKKKFDFRSIEIIRDYAPEMPEVPMSSVEMEQVMLNLLKNAAQAMIENPPDRKPKITLRLRREERYAVLEVEDNGPGMAEEIRRRVFEPFFTTKEPGIGTGLGLSVSYMIVTQNHKGLMEAASTPGRGACFTVSLPVGVHERSSMEDANG